MYQDACLPFASMLPLTVSLEVYEQSCTIFLQTSLEDIVTKKGEKMKKNFAARTVPNLSLLSFPSGPVCRPVSSLPNIITFVLAVFALSLEQKCSWL